MREKARVSRQQLTQVRSRHAVQSAGHEAAAICHLHVGPAHHAGAQEEQEAAGLRDPVFHACCRQVAGFVVVPAGAGGPARSQQEVSALGLWISHAATSTLPRSEAQPLQLQLQRRHLVRSGRLEVALGERMRRVGQRLQQLSSRSLSKPWCLPGRSACHSQPAKGACLSPQSPAEGELAAGPLRAAA